MKTTTLPPPATTAIPTLILALSLAAATAGCSFKSDVKESGEFFKKIFSKDTYAMYRIDIQQGNTIAPDKLAQLKPGMTKEQVRYLLGNPVADNVFRKDRWHYTYYLIPGTGETEQYRLTLLFDDDRLRDIRKSKQLAKLMQKPRTKKKKPRGKSGAGG